MSRVNLDYGFFPFPIPPAEEWDGETYYSDDDLGIPVGIPSGDGDNYVAVVGEGTFYPVGFTLSELMRIYWRITKWNYTPAVTSPSTVSVDVSPFSIPGPSSGTFITQAYEATETPEDTDGPEITYTPDDATPDDPDVSVWRSKETDLVYPSLIINAQGVTQSWLSQYSAGLSRTSDTTVDPVQTITSESLAFTITLFGGQGFFGATFPSLGQLLAPCCLKKDDLYYPHIEIQISAQGRNQVITTVDPDAHTTTATDQSSTTLATSLKYDGWDTLPDPVDCSESESFDDTVTVAGKDIPVFGVRSLVGTAVDVDGNITCNPPDDYATAGLTAEPAGFWPYGDPPLYDEDTGEPVTV